MKQEAKLIPLTSIGKSGPQLDKLKESARLGEVNNVEDAYSISAVLITIKGDASVENELHFKRPKG